MARKKSVIADTQPPDDTVNAIAAAFGLPTSELHLSDGGVNEPAPAPSLPIEHPEHFTIEEYVPDFLKGDASHVQAEHVRQEETAREEEVKIFDYPGHDTPQEYDVTFDPTHKGGPMYVEPAGVGFEVADEAELAANIEALQPASEPTEEPVLSNSGGLTRKDFDREVRKLGTALGQGKNSMPSLALRTLEALNRITDMSARDKTLPEVIFNEFMAKASAASGLERGEMASYKTQLSKFKQFFEATHAGVDSYGMMLRAVDIIKGLYERDDKPLKGGVYENMVVVARAQKAVKDRELYDAEIEGALIKEKTEKSEVEKLGDLLNKVRKAHDWAPAGALPGIEEAAHNIEDAIRSIGGEVPGEATEDGEGTSE